MVVLRNESNKYGVYTLDGNEIIGAKYDNIKFIESSMEFILSYFAPIISFPSNV